MPRIASVHSFGGATGTSFTANLVVSIARLGYRVGVIDTGEQSPSIHNYFALDGEATDLVWNDYVWNGYSCNDDRLSGHSGTYQSGDRSDRSVVSHAQRSTGVSLALPIVREGAGEVVVMGRGIYLIPFAVRAGDVSRVLREGHEVDPLKDGIHTLIERLQVDYLLIDTHPGTTEEIVFSIALSDTLVVMLRPDQIEYQATAVTVEIGRRLHVPKILLVVDNLPTGFDSRNVHEQVEHTFNTVVAGILPYSGTITTATGKSIFCRQRPDHPWSREVASIARQIMA